MKTINVWIIVSVLTGLIVSAAYAAPWHHKRKHSLSNKPYSPYRYHPYHGKRVFLPKLMAKAIIFGGIEYYYQHGLFYKRIDGAYVVVDPPIGAVVESIPAGYKVLSINNNSYYYYNDVYFVKGSKGYVVVKDPVYHVVQLPDDVEVIEDSDLSNGISKIPLEYTVNIPNENGSYTPVQIVKSGDGYIGPQGEYYTDFLEVNQLKVMYGK